LLKLLRDGCRDLEFLPARVADDPKQVRQVLAADSEVDGYLLCLLGLGWRNDVVKLASTGKPTLIFDNLFGGSGKLLTTLRVVMKSGRPVDWIASSDDRHLVVVARHFGLLCQGRTAQEVVAAFRAARHKPTPRVTDWTAEPDRVPTPDFEKALKELRQTRIVVVGGGWGGETFRRAAREVVGVEFVPVKLEELAAAYETASLDEAQRFADRWAEKAEEVVEPSRDDLVGSGRMYAAMKQLMRKYQAQGISVNCLGGFYGGHLKAYPCLGFSDFNNRLLVGGCEADQMSALTMVTVSKLVGRPGFISDPVVDISRNAVIYAHCVAMTKPFGPDGPSNPYRIRSHSEDRKGASIQSLLPAGYLVTTLEINPTTRQVLLHQAKTIGNNASDLACRTKLEAVVKGDLEKLAENWGLGWHRVTFYGDLSDVVAELCDRLKLKLVLEA